jgi:2-dehydro-3-deoxyphosphogluconate aldolase/(4S)-4-hydroxy-2-oxoglutarate aldolase
MSDTSLSEMTGLIESAGIVAIMRADSDRGLVRACQAMVAGGLRVAEVPLTTPGALAVVSQIASEMADRVLIGTGSVLDADSVHRSADAGARFIVSPTFKPEVLEASHKLGLPCLPGALTPTEILTAWEAGADIVKVFPAHRLGGAAYLREVLGPLPHVKLMPTGGVRLDTVGDWFAAGAVSLGVGTSLIRTDLVEAGDWDALTEHTRVFVAAVKAGRPHSDN